MRLYRTRFQTVYRAAVFVPAVAALAFLVGCAGDPTGGTNTDLGSVTVSVSPGEILVAPGVTSISAVTLTRINGYLGTVALTADSLPTGVSVSFDPSTLGGVSTTALMTVTAVSTAVPGTTALRVKASGTSAGDSTDISVTVATGAISLATPANDVSVPQGASGRIPLSVTRTNGFAGGVTLTAEGLPANVIATFSPALVPAGSNASTLMLSAPAGTALGTTPITIRARGKGVVDKTAAVQLAVVAPTVAGFTLVPDSSAFTTVAGGTTSQTVLHINRFGGFTGAVALLAPSQSGITATVSPASTTDNSATVSVGASGATAPGTYLFSVVGNASGATMVSVPFSVVVREKPTVALQLVPSTLRIVPGSFAQTAVLITRVGGLTGDFVMTAEGLPSGVTAIFGSSVVLGTATSLTFAATTNATPGVYNVIVKASAGSDVGSATVVLTVAASGSAAASVAPGN